MMFTESTPALYFLGAFAALVGVVGTWFQTNAIAEQADGIQNSLEKTLEQFYQSSFVKVSSFLPVVKKCLPKSSFDFPDSERSSSWIETLYEDLPFIRTNLMARQALSGAENNARTFAMQKETFESSVLGKLLATFGASLEEVEVTESTHSKMYLCCLVIGPVLMVTFALIDLFKLLKSRPGFKNSASQAVKEQTENYEEEAAPMEEEIEKVTEMMDEKKPENYREETVEIEDANENGYEKQDVDEKEIEVDSTGTDISDNSNVNINDDDADCSSSNSIVTDNCAVSPTLVETVESLDYPDESLEKEEQNENGEKEEETLEKDSTESYANDNSKDDNGSSSSSSIENSKNVDADDDRDEGDSFDIVCQDDETDDVTQKKENVEEKEETENGNEKNEEKEDEKQVANTDSDVNNNSKDDGGSSDRDDENGSSQQDDDADLPAFVESGKCQFKIKMDEKDQAIVSDKKGNLIKLLQGKALVNVLPRTRGDLYLTVEGEREEVEIAVDAIFDYIRQWKANPQSVQAARETTLKPAPRADENLKLKKENEFNFEVDKEHSGIVLGKGSAHAARYLKENNVTIRLDNSQGNVLVTLSGKPCDVMEVYDNIMKRLEAVRKELSKPLDELTEVVPGLLRVTGNRYVFRIKDFQRKYLIGPSGKTVRTLEEYFGVAIHARKGVTDAKSVVCEIIGLKDDVIWAFEEIEIVLRQRGLKYEQTENPQKSSSENDQFK